jgi:hypothetical protein
MLVFQRGLWKQVPLPRPLDPTWTIDYQNIYALVFTRLMEKGYGDRSQSIAEAFIYKKIHHGLKYSKDVESIMRDLLGTA